MDRARLSATFLAATDVPPRHAFWVSAASVILLDLLSKRIAIANLPVGMGLPVLGDWFELRLFFNQNGPFSISLGPASRWIFVALTVLVLVGLLWFSLTSGARSPIRQEAFGLILGGGAGNLVSRLGDPRGVADFFQLYFGPMRWPAFNVADVAISMGAVALALSLLLHDGNRPGLGEAAPGAE